MTRVIRPHHWFFALTLSALLHGWVIYSVNFFPFEAVEKESIELPFTVLLSDQEVAEQMVLEDPQVLSSDVIPLVSLDEEGPEEPLSIDLNEPLPPGTEVLEWEAGVEPPEVAVSTAEELALDAQPELGMPRERVIRLLQSEALEPEVTATVPSLSSVAVLPLESLLQMEERPVPVVAEVVELEPEAPELSMDQIIEVAPELSLEVLDQELDLAVDEVSPEPVAFDAAVEAVAAPEPVMPQQNLQSEVILAEITVEQMAFDQHLFRTLPEVKAEEWRPEHSVPGERGAAEWKRRYAGASGISASYRKRMRTTLTQFVLYPKAVAEEQGVEGKVVIGFTINREGRLESTEILESSGHDALDRAVVKMVEFAQPFTRLPKTVNSDKVRFAFPVTIQLKR